MESSQKRTSGGLWNTARPLPYSRELQERLKLQKQESDYISLQRSKTNESQKKVAPLPQKGTPASQQPESKKAVPVQSFSSSRRRSAETCRLWSSFTREPPNLPPPKDLEKEKRRLINLMAYGVEDPTGLIF